ncbi:MAG TPA: AraC family transcriptional regulator [Ferruginibacter sp.]|nr:AraC family transcriptional regulator [Ferruginibacter sp.]HMP21196.1 AraC family transcriptional regulator [Ferruginibacter sp.]
MLLLQTANYLGNTKLYYATDNIHVKLITYSRPDFETGSEQWHAHENTHFTFFMKGGTVEQRKQHTYKRTAGEISFYNSGELHMNSHTLFPSVNLNLEVEAAFLKKYAVTESEIQQCTLFNPQSRIALLQLYNELNRDTPNPAFLQMTLLQLLLPERNETCNFPAWTKRIREFLADEWYETPSLEKLSEIAGVHPVTISKHFNRYFHCTLSEYMRSIKIEKAISLINSTSHSLEEIGFTCGFADKSHFSKVFREQTGILPGAYRKL